MSFGVSSIPLLLCQNVTVRGDTPRYTFTDSLYAEMTTHTFLLVRRVMTAFGPICRRSLQIAFGNAYSFAQTLSSKTTDSWEKTPG